jgi:hypothetical protein
MNVKAKPRLFFCVLLVNELLLLYPPRTQNTSLLFSGLLPRKKAALGEADRKSSFDVIAPQGVSPFTSCGRKESVAK